MLLTFVSCCVNIGTVLVYFQCTKRECRVARFVLCKVLEWYHFKVSVWGCLGYNFWINEIRFCVGMVFKSWLRFFYWFFVEI